ncbi:MAG: virulence protein RhuM/Fic/DOC family protein [Candidatus Taylorbacteria bacterium]|nr:virulence protein RhuM/Fic/DOC family protein [Candidatus Taylorbacteria bacterium]
MKKEGIKNEVVIYQAKNGAIELRGDFTHETVWANRMQMALMFDVNPQAISKHIQNIYNEKELERKATSSKMELVRKEAGRQVHRNIDIYNLDILIAVGYRINSIVGTKFRQWATRTLRGYIVDGYAVNKKRIAINYSQFLGVVDSIKKLLPSGSTIDPKDAIDLVSLFADTWLSLDAYDKDALPKGKLTKKKVELTTEMITNSLAQLKKELINESEATDIFGTEINRGSVAGIVGNVMQSFGGKELYESAEEKAAHLLYFMVKNHPFTDGNKRSGAFAFVWFLKQANILDVSKLTPSALTALTILVASSDPKDKEKVVALTLNLIARK